MHLVGLKESLSCKVGSDRLAAAALEESESVKFNQCTKNLQKAAIETCNCSLSSNFSVELDIDVALLQDYEAETT